MGITDNYLPIYNGKLSEYTHTYAHMYISPTSELFSDFGFILSLVKAFFNAYFYQ